MPRRYRRKRTHILPGRVITNAINIDHDKDERFVIRKCLSYLQQHLNRHFMLDSATMSIICWALGHEMEQIGDFLLDFFDDDQKNDFEESLLECGTDHDEYADVLINMLQRVGIKHLRKFKQLIFSLLDQRFKDLKYSGLSHIEKSTSNLKMMFKLTDQEVEICLFLFIINTYDVPESFFDNHLNCTKFSGRKYLFNTLNLNQNKLNGIFSGTLEKACLLEVDKYNMELTDNLSNWFQNPSDRILSESFYSPIKSNALPINYHFIGDDQIKLILRLLEEKPKTSTHILLYGPAGTGKSSFAHGLVQELGIPAYEIVREKKNTTENRRAAIIACLNMTNTGKGSIILVDEADNILNTQCSWFMRGETQDKGWLNQLLEEPGTRMIWITNHLFFIENSVLRRFAYSVHFKPFNRRQRIQLWNNILQENKAKRFFDRSNIDAFAKKYKVSAGAIDLAVKKALAVSPRSKIKLHRSVTMALDSHLTLMNYGEKPANKNEIEASYSLDGLNVQGDIKAMIDQLGKFDLFLRQSEPDKIMNMNLLFYGPPGTGKSELARYIAEKLDRGIICKRVSDLHNKYVGESEKNIKNAFEEAEAEESILIIDEADSLLFNRDRAQRSWEISFTNEFLSQMERFKGILICTTNRFEDLDNASIRRLNHKIGFNYLKPEGNIIFYKKLLLPLIKSPMNNETTEALIKIIDLSPGDFKTVRDRYSFYPGKELNHQILIGALQEEARLKKIHQGDKPIGF
ncbi:ATP-binding protein [candidate division KSB1 bacterium]|nr:ATP-binding protein [candidate division KSB1 bacterium]